jgi:hypothetical protein
MTWASMKLLYFHMTKLSPIIWIASPMLTNYWPEKKSVVFEVAISAGAFPSNVNGGRG